MPIKLPDLTGTKQGRLTIIRAAGSDEKKYKLYESKCDCGTIKLVRAARVASGELQSCGCLLVEARNRNIKKAQEKSTKHGLSGSLIYQTWNSMMLRCYNHHHENFHRYGGVGIGACDFVRSSPQNLLEIVGERPEKNHSLDRIDGKIGYTCGKCEQCKKMEWPMNLKWSTASEQSHNTKSNVWITIDGVRKLCSDWAKEMGRSYHYVRDNYKADD